MGYKAPPLKLYCPRCGKELRVIPDTGSRDYGYCSHCNSWERGKP